MKKSIRVNYIYNMIYQILIMILPVITMPYVSRVLGADGIGIYGYTSSTLAYFILFGSLGISLYGQREIAYLRDNKEKRSYAFYEIIFLRLVTMIISMLVYYFVLIRTSKYSLYYLIFLLEFISTIFDISWFFQGIEEFDKIVFRQLITKILSVICIFVFVKKPSDLVIYILIYVLSLLVGNASLWFYLPKYISKINIKTLNIAKHIKPTISLFIPQIAMQIYLVLDKTMIGKILKNMSEVGNYEQSQKIIKITLVLVTSLGTVVASRIANNIANRNNKLVSKQLEKSFKFVWFLATPITFGAIAIAKNLVPWFLGPGYEQSIRIIMYGSALILAIGLNNVTGIQYLIPAKKQNLYTNSVILGAIINFSLNLMLIPKYGAIGAIGASVIAEVSIFIIQLIYLKKIISIKSVFNKSYKNIISSIIMFIIVYYIGNKLNPSMINTFILVFIGFSIYILLTLILKDEILIETLEFIKKKIIRRK